ncbi:hypothetical protein DSO57_1036308 [Entomophthora muscae]|uniref:Uncharacterized protein n=1 Tax=Entomophthora muscae TaxID=34485 RepID=A0ACC2TAP4_9FUNG|nr:hypothetical protein DSO57_1036308 [Entomophthora muscae]
MNLTPKSQVVSSPPLGTNHAAFPLVQLDALCSLASPLPDIPLSLPGTLLHDMLLAQCSTPDSLALHSKLTPENPKEGAYILKESMVYQKRGFGLLKPCTCVS